MRIQFTFYSDYFQLKPELEVFRLDSHQKAHWGHGNIYEVHWMWFHFEFCRIYGG